MPRIEQFVCDCGCGAVRQTSNHWRMLWIKENEWTITEWEESLAYDLGVKYLAGQDCAHKMLDRFLSIAKPPIKPEAEHPQEGTRDEGLDH